MRLAPGLPASPAAPPEVEALANLLPDGWATTTETPDGQRRGICIESTRFVTTILQAAGVPCRPMACDVTAFNARAWKEWSEEGVGPDAWSEGAWTVGVTADDAETGPSLTEPHRRSGWGGHLITVGDGWFADFTTEQFHRPKQDIHVNGAVIGPLEPDVAGVIAQNDEDGTTIRWAFRPEIRAWRTTPAWRQDVSRELVATTLELLHSYGAGSSSKST